MYTEEELEKFSPEIQAKIRKEIDAFIANGYDRQFVIIRPDGEWYYDTQAESDAEWKKGLAEDP